MPEENEGMGLQQSTASSLRFGGDNNVGTVQLMSRDELMKAGVMERRDSPFDQYKYLVKRERGKDLS